MVAPTRLRQYGLPYKGSKNAIAPWVIDHIPPATTLYDLFCGGCAITHAALLSGKWRKVVANDIDGDMPRFFLHCANGGMRGENQWISREDFFRLKDTDPYVRVCWSFANDGRTYLYSRAIEPYKRAVHYAVVFNDWTDMYRLCPEVAAVAEARLSWFTDTKERRIEIGRGIVRHLRKYGTVEMIAANPLYHSCHWARGKPKFIPSPVNPSHIEPLVSLERLERLQALQSLEGLERLQSLERLERLQSLESLERDDPALIVLTQSYEDVEIPDPANSVIYCDPPYNKTEQEQYVKQGGQAFNSPAFFDWCERQKALTIISEYDMPLDRFTLIAERERKSGASSGGVIVIERLFIPRHQRQLYTYLTGKMILIP